MKQITLAEFTAHLNLLIAGLEKVDSENKNFYIHYIRKAWNYYELYQESYIYKTRPTYTANFIIKLTQILDLGFRQGDRFAFTESVKTDELLSMIKEKLPNISSYF